MARREEDIERAVAELAAGKLIGLPTETVYGLAADGTNPAAVRRIFAQKGRPTGHPLILHLGESAWIHRYARDVPPLALDLAEAYWPGPLTLVLKRTEEVPLEVTGGLDTVALRVPRHPLALEVLRRLGRPLAAPSANRFGEVSPTTRAHVIHDFGDTLFVLDGGPCDVGLESTIVDLTEDLPRVLRPGGITEGQISQTASRALGKADEGAPAVPGTLEAHYAPRAELRLVDPSRLYGEVVHALDEGETVGVFGPDAPPAALQSRISFEKMGSIASVAHDLYATLRRLDDARCTVIFSVFVDESGLGRAVADRMKRACVGSRRSRMS